MLTQTKIFTMVIVLLMLLTTACGAQPAGTGAQAEPETEAEPAGDVVAEEVSAETEEEEAQDDADHDEEMEAAQDEEAEEHSEDEHDEEAEEHGEDEHEHDEEAQEHDEDEHEQDEAEHAHEEEHEHDAAVELDAVDLAEGEKLRVVATTNIVGDLVRNVAGDMIDLTTMLPIGSDPHTFTPAPQDVTIVADADVVFVNGLGLEEFLADLIENAGGEAPTVALSTNVETREFEAGEGHGHGDEEGDHHDEKEAEHDEHDEEAEEHREDEDDHAQDDEPGHAHEGVDPHIWMTPANVIVMVHNIEHALSELDPANAETYEANAEAYEAELEALDAWVMEQIAAIPEENREMVTDHDSFGYYADHYGLEVVGAVIPNYSTNAEPSAQELAELQDAVGEYGVQAVFVGTTVNPVLAEQLATDSGIKLITLYTGSLGEAGSEVESYIDLIRYNTEAIVAALKPEA